MSLEGGGEPRTRAEGADERAEAAGPRYYLRAGNREKGPFSLEQLRASLAEGTMSRASLVRAEGEIDEQPLGEVLEGASFGAARPARTKGAKAADTQDALVGGALDNVYAPPRAVDPEPSLATNEVEDRGGSFGLGLALGLLGGCIALALSGGARPKTQKGIATGFLVGVMVGLLRVFLSDR